MSLLWQPQPRWSLLPNQVITVQNNSLSCYVMSLMKVHTITNTTVWSTTIRNCITVATDLFTNKGISYPCSSNLDFIAIWGSPLLVKYNPWWDDPLDVHTCEHPIIHIWFYYIDSLPLGFCFFTTPRSTEIFEVITSSILEIMHALI